MAIQKKFLDKTGLEKFWIKAKEWVTSQITSNNGNYYTKSEVYTKTETDAKITSELANYDTTTVSEGKIATAKQGAIDAAKAYTDQVKGEILGEGALEDAFDTLKEVGDWAKEHGTEYATLVGTVTGLESSKLDVETYESDKATFAIASEVASTYETKTDATAKLTEAKGYTDSKLEDYSTTSEIESMIDELAISDEEIEALFA